MEIALITEDQSRNSLGRTYCLWLLAKELGWTAHVLTTEGDEVWAPLRGSEFADSVRRVPKEQLTRSIPLHTDLIVACKPLPNSLGQAEKVARDIDLPLLLDIDDPDLEVRTRAGDPVMAILRWARRPLRSFDDARRARVARQLPTIVSNPWLANRYGGDVVPHVRPVIEPGPDRGGPDLQIVFVGTNHAHKGVHVLREAVARMQNEPATTRLTVTDAPPADAFPWENWVGTTSMSEGMNLARNADVIVLPSLPGRHATGQLPVKLVDAMMLGRPVVVSDVAPLPWAVGEAGIVVEAGDVDALVRAVSQLRDPSRRAQLGSAARAHAVAVFSVGAVAGTFERACLSAASAR